VRYYRSPIKKIAFCAFKDKTLFKQKNFFSHERGAVKEFFFKEIISFLGGIRWNTTNGRREGGGACWAKC